ncbi:MAG TPA: sulfotransferase [Myxococcota bacterium]|nr:sulfotransferase [Myxococcota bacterium]
MESPVFLLGAERSGTTLLRLMLDGHPQIAWPCEFDFALDWPAAEAGEWPDLIDYWSALAESRHARQMRIVIQAQLAFPELVRSLHAQICGRTSKPIAGVTAHRQFARVLRLWPDARFVYLVRDGRDVARSRVEMGWAGNVWAAASAWRETERDWRRLCAAVPAERRIEVRYEDLVRNPRGELTRICDFLDVDYSPGMLEYPARSTYEAPDPRVIARWRKKLSVRELTWLEREIGAELRARSYAPSRVPAAWIPAPRRVALRLGDRIGRMRFRMRRYGAGLWAKHQVARRFHFAALRRVTAGQMRTIDAAFLK